MKIYHSLVPQFFIEKQNISNKVNWLYLGNSYKVLNRLKKMFGENGHQIQFNRELYAVSENERRGFVAWIDALSEKILLKEWYFSTAAVKNPTNSLLFLNSCLYFVFEKLVRRNEKIDFVFVDSSALLKILKQEFSNQIKSPVVNSFAAFASCIIRVAKLIARWMIFALEIFQRFIAAKFVLKKRAQSMLLKLKSVVFIRNYITGDFSDLTQGSFESHFFPGLNNYIEKSGCDPVYLSVPVKTSNYSKLFKKVKESKQRIIFIEEFLQWQDFFFALMAPLWAFGITLPKISYKNFDFSALLREEYFSNLTESGMLTAVLYSKFAVRLKKSGITPRGLINWAEFQAFEKGLLVGMRDEYPAVPVIYSQPFFVSENHLSIFQSKQDMRIVKGIDKVLVVGNINKLSAIEYSQNCVVDITPAFRYRAILSKECNNPKANTIIVLLGYEFANAIFILKTLFEIADALQHFDAVLIKSHPLGNFHENIVLKYLDVELPKNFRFIYDPISDYINDLAMGICGATGTSVELVMQGIPVILIAETHALTMNYLAYKEDPIVWRLCYDSSEVLEAIHLFLKVRKENISLLLDKSRQFKEAYISSDQEAHWDNYLIH